MKTRFFAVVALALMAMGASAQDKIAVVDVNAAIFSSNAAKVKLEAFQKNSEYVSLKAKFDSATADLQALGKEWDSKSVTWSAEQKAEHQKKMEYINADRELAARKIKAETQNMQQQVMQEIGPVAEKALQDLVKSEGVSLLLPREAVLWAAADKTLTAKLLDKINAAAK